MEYVENAIWTSTVGIFNLSIVQIVGAIIYFFYSAGYVDLCQRWAVLILFIVGATIDTVVAIRMWKEFRMGKGRGWRA